MEELRKKQIRTLVGSVGVSLTSFFFTALSPKESFPSASVAAAICCSFLYSFLAVLGVFMTPAPMGVAPPPFKNDGPIFFPVAVDAPGVAGACA